MDTLPPLRRPTKKTSTWHGGNEYRGPGAWKQLKKRERHRGRREPLDLTRILSDLHFADNSNSNSNLNSNTKGNIDTRDQKCSRIGNDSAIASGSALLPQRAPSHVVGGSIRIASTPLAALHVAPTLHASDKSPVQKSIHACLSQESPRSGVVGTLLPASYVPAPCQQQRVSIGDRTSHVPSDIEHMLGKGPLSSTHKSCQQFSCTQEWKSASELRIPKAAVKMAVDDRCNAEVLEERSILRSLYAEHAKIVSKMRQRRLDVSLAMRGRLDSSLQKYSSALVGRKSRNHEKRKKGKAGARDSRRLHHTIQPLLLMTEAELQENELENMQLEDAESAHLARLEEARRRKQDYAVYYSLALRYGPFDAEEFGVAPYPGSAYRTKVQQAARIAQNWWWGVWPPLLRRRKIAALMAQSAFRGFLQRKRWNAIIRLRTLWGTTRFVARVFVCWQKSSIKSRRVAAFARRLQNGIVRRCLATWAGQVDAKRKRGENLVRQRLRRVEAGMTQRIFDAWVAYSEISRKIEHMHRRSITWPTFDAWRHRVYSDHVTRRLNWACAKLVSRNLRWHLRTRFLRLRDCAGKIQRLARKKLERARVQRHTTARRTRMAERIVNDIQDERLRLLVEDEQGRRGRLQAILDKSVAEGEKRATIFLQQPAGRAAIAAEKLWMKKTEHDARQADESVTSSGSFDPKGSPLSPNANARHRIIHAFVQREEVVLRHDFNAQWPPPLCCPYPDCHATFVNLAHGVRHTADTHSGSASGISKMGLVLSEPVLLEAFDNSLGEESALREGAMQTDCDHLLSALNQEKRVAVRQALSLWKAIQQWKSVPRCSDTYGELYEIAFNQLDKCGYKKGGFVGSSSDRNECLAGNSHSRLMKEKVSATNDDAEEDSRRAPTSTSSKTDHLHGADSQAFDSQALEEASWQALVTLHETAGKAFLASSLFTAYLHSVKALPKKEVSAAFNEIVQREHRDWMRESQALRATALRHREETAVDEMAESAMNVMFKGDKGLTATLIEDQVVILYTIIVAEKSAFSEVVSAIWNEMVEEAARLHSRELREVPLELADALSEVVCLKVRTVVMDGLLDECVVELTGLGRDLSPEGRAAAAIADGVVYRVRSNVMERIIDESLSRLFESGETEELTSEVTSRRTSHAEHKMGHSSDVEGSMNVLEDTRSERESDAQRERRLGSSERGQSNKGFSDEAPVVGTGTMEEGDEKHYPSGGHCCKPGHDGNHQSRQPGGEAPPGRLTWTAAESWASCEDDSSGAIDPTEDAVQLPCGGDKDHLSSSSFASTEAFQEGDATILTAAIIPRATIAGRFSADTRAAVIIQSALRRRAVYRATKVLVARNYVKIYDPSSGCFYWYNQTTGESTWEKPLIIDVYFKKSGGVGRKAFEHFGAR